MDGTTGLILCFLAPVGTDMGASVSPSNAWLVAVTINADATAEASTYLPYGISGAPLSVGAADAQTTYVSTSQAMYAATPFATSTISAGYQSTVVARLPSGLSQLLVGVSQRPTYVCSGGLPPGGTNTRLCLVGDSDLPLLYSTGSTYGAGGLWGLFGSLGWGDTPVFVFRDNSTIYVAASTWSYMIPSDYSPRMAATTAVGVDPGGGDLVRVFKFLPGSGPLNATWAEDQIQRMHVYVNTVSSINRPRLRRAYTIGCMQQPCLLPAECSSVSVPSKLEYPS